jgi:hypothetical protein
MSGNWQKLQEQLESETCGSRQVVKLGDFTSMRRFFAFLKVGECNRDFSAVDVVGIPENGTGRTVRQIVNQGCPARLLHSL